MNRLLQAADEILPQDRSVQETRWELFRAAEEVELSMKQSNHRFEVSASAFKSETTNQSLVVIPRERAKLIGSRGFSHHALGERDHSTPDRLSHQPWPFLNAQCDNRRSSARYYRAEAKARARNPTTRGSTSRTFCRPDRGYRNARGDGAQNGSRRTNKRKARRSSLTLAREDGNSVAAP